MQKEVSFKRFGYRDFEDELQQSEEEEEEEEEVEDEWGDIGSREIVIREEKNPSFQVMGSRTPIKPYQLHLLKEGDHIGWHRPWKVYWHHAIVNEVDSSGGRVKVCHYAKIDGIFKITEQWLYLKEQSGDLFRFDYSSTTVKMNPSHVVKERALKRVGERGYKVLKNNCEHFARYCKTGKSDCTQVHWLGGKVKGVVGTALSYTVTSGTKMLYSVAKAVSEKSKIVRSVSRAVVNQGYKCGVESTVKIGGAEALERVGRSTNWVGAGLVAALETGHCVYDIYKMNQSRKAGHITDRDFKVCTTQRVSEGVLGGGLAIGGSIGGQALGGIIGGAIGTCFNPGVGTAIGTAVGSFIGSVAGGVLGSIVGKLGGTVLGNWLGNWLF